MSAATRHRFWPALVMAACVAGCAFGPGDGAASPGSNPAAEAGESPSVAAPLAAGASRPGPVRQPSPPDLDPPATVAIRYFAHARFSLVRDEQGQPLGVRVESVLDNGRVYWAGVREGDLLTRINDVLLNDPRTFEEAVRLVEDQFLLGRPQRIHIVRGGKASALVPMGLIKSEPVPQTQP